VQFVGAAGQADTLKLGITVAIGTKVSEMVERVYRPDASRLTRSVTNADFKFRFR
jgi:hypothetical protein